MKEFLILIYKQDEAIAPLVPEKDIAFLKACESYIETLKKGGNLKSAQPIQRNGKVISGSKGNLKVESLSQSKRVNGGYYHIMAKDMDDAVAIAKQNPEFEYGTNVSLEVHTIKGEEASTGYVYPK
jgi:hypothetical protein